MALNTATPYLILGGRAREALDFYAAALEGEVTAVQRFGDIDQSCPEALRDHVIHAEVRAGDAVLLLSDGAPSTETAMSLDEAGGGGAAARSATTVQVALAFGEASALRRSFDALAEGGEVVEAVFDAPWGGVFGALRDRFGIHWMFTGPREG